MKLRFQKDGTFKIMQITDMQEIPAISKDTIALMERAALEEQPDLVVYTGDQIKGYGVTYKGKGEELEREVAQTIGKLLEPVTKRGIPFAVTFGNHDCQVGISNQDQFWFEIKQLIPVVACLFVLLFIGSLIILGIMFLINTKVYNIGLAMYFIAFISSYIQGNFLVKNLPGLDGTQPVWKDYISEDIKTIVVWVVVSAVVIAFSIKFKPGVLYSCLSKDISTLVDNHLSLQKYLNQKVIDELKLKSSFAERVQFVENWLLSNMKIFSSDFKLKAVTKAIYYINNSHDYKLNVVSKEVGVSNPTLNRYFKEAPNGFAEIDETEYKARKEAAKARMEATDGAK